MLNIIKTCPWDEGVLPYVQYPQHHAYQIAGETAEHPLQHSTIQEQNCHIRCNTWFIISEESTEERGHGAVQVAITLKEKLILTDNNW
jgi:hypothetical protein